MWERILPRSIVFRSDEKKNKRYPKQKKNQINRNELKNINRDQWWTAKNKIEPLEKKMPPDYHQSHIDIGNSDIKRNENKNPTLWENWTV